jgi:hypothetical protein
LIFPNNELCSQQFFSLSLETLFLSLIRAYGEKNGTNNSLINNAPMAKKMEQAILSLISRCDINKKIEKNIIYDTLII